MNEYEIEDAVLLHRPAVRPNLAAAAITLQNLMRWVNSHSDGWPYWNPPKAAAKKLMALLQAHDPRDMDPPDCTLEDLKRAYQPLKSFRTRANKGESWGMLKDSCDFEIFDPSMPVVVPRIECPMPGDKLGDRTVVASGIHIDDVDRPTVYGVLVINPDPHYFTILEIVLNDDCTAIAQMIDLGNEANIVPAVHVFHENFGFWDGGALTDLGNESPHG